MAEVFLGLGSNLGEPAENLRRAVERLSGILAIGRISSVYRTEPVGLRAQPHFLNAVVSGATAAEPHDLLAAARALEDEMGRQRHEPMGPRTIDVDVLVYGDRVVDDGGLVLPHPRMAERRFVLVPLAEIAPRLCPPGWDRTVSEVLARLPDAHPVERLELPGWPPPGRPI